MTSEERIAHGILAGVKLSIKQLIGSTLSPDEAREYFKTKQEEIDQGLELIPGKIRIRKVNKTDVERFSKEPYRWRQDEIPNIGEVLIEGEYDHESEFKTEFNVITKTQLALCLLKQQPVFVKSLYSFSKDSNIPNEWHILLPIPEPALFAQFGISIFPDDKDDIINILNKINTIDFSNNSSMRIACSRFLKSHHNLSSADILIDFCISSEALFLKGEYPKSELGMGQVIGLACSMLLGQDNDERKEISDAFVTAFARRNDAVHGRPFKKQLPPDLISTLENNLRISILRLIS